MQLTIADEKLNGFIDAVFPFPLTGAQRRVIEDIRGDLTKPVPMNRLLQGDVGSGKTAVAATALAIALMNGQQSALMAPTSILAEQHYRGIGAMFARMPAELMPREGKPVIALLTGSVSPSDREAIYRGLADGSIDIVIGTHAIIQEGVEFKNLAVAIIDEQHRFGVEQRGALRGKGTNPHLLVMTATPIPRTLALTLYADLDLSIIDEMPPGRIPIRTRVIERIAPFTPADVAYLSEVILARNWAERLGPYLDAHSLRMLAQVCDPDHEGFALRRPDFHFLQTFTMALGRR